jgi:phosphoserine phosphatase RsbU/P
VLYSDGLVEAANFQDEELGEERVAAIVREHVRDTAEEIRDRILSSVQAFTGRTVPEDDQTLFVIVYSGVRATAKGQERFAYIS